MGRNFSFRLFRRTSSTKSINNKHTSPQRYETDVDEKVATNNSGI